MKPHREQSIAGNLGMREMSLLSASADYDARARAHRPNDADAIAREIKRLAAGGLSARDIAGALRIDLGAVINTLQGRA